MTQTGDFGHIDLTELTREFNYFEGPKVTSLWYCSNCKTVYLEMPESCPVCKIKERLEIP